MSCWSWVEPAFVWLLIALVAVAGALLLMSWAVTTYVLVKEGEHPLKAAALGFGVTLLGLRWRL